MLVAEQVCNLREEVRRLQEMVEKQSQYLKDGDPREDNGLSEKRQLLEKSPLLKIRVTDNINIGTKFTLKMIGQDPKEMMLVDEVLADGNQEEFICKNSSLGQLLFGKKEGDFVLETFEKGNTVVLGRVEEIKKDPRDYVHFIRDQKNTRDRMSKKVRREFRLLKEMKDVDFEAMKKWEDWHTITFSQQQLLKEELQYYLEAEKLSFVEQKRLFCIRQILKENQLAQLPQDDSIGVGTEFSITLQTEKGLVTKRVEMINQAFSNETDREFIERISPMGYQIFGLKEQETFHFYSSKFGNIEGIVFDIDNIKKSQKTIDPTLYHVRNVKKYGLVREQRDLLEEELAYKIKALEMRKNTRRKEGYTFLRNSEIDSLKRRIDEINGMLEKQNIIENPNSDTIDIGSSFTLSLDDGNGETEEL